MAENNFSALVQLIVDKAQARSALQRELKELQREAQLETDVKVNLSDVRQARKEIEKANKEQQQGTRENIKLRAQELAHARMVAKETKVATDLEIANRQREMKLSNQAMSEELANRKRVAQEQKVATQEELASRESIRKLNEQTFKEESSARRQAIAEMRLQAQEQRALKSSVQGQVNKIQHSLSIGDYDTQLKGLETSLQRLGYEGEKLENAMEGVRTAYAKLDESATLDPLSDGALQKLDTYNDEVEKLQNLIRQVKLNESLFADDIQVDNTVVRLNDQLRKNSKYSAEAKKQIKLWIEELNKGDVSVARLKEINSEAKQLHVRMANLNKIGFSNFDKLMQGMESFKSWLSATSIVMGVINAFKQMTTNVYKLDESLVELTKVYDSTAEGLEKITEEAYELGETLGKTGTQVLDAATSFKRAGYEISESMQFAEEALKTTNISENLKDASEAAENLVHIMKGFQNSTPEFASHINDAINEVSNTQSVDFDNLVDGSERLSAVAKQAGMSFEQMLGTLTGAYEILGDMEKVASGQITIFTRLQAIQMEGEEEVSTVAKLQETFSNATNGAVNIVDQTSGQLRNVYDILDDLNDVWADLDKNTQEALAFEAAGTRQKSVFLALMSNWSEVEESINSATNSMGSADKENAKHLDSLAGHTANFTSSVEELSATLVDGEILKSLIDIGTFGVKSLNGLAEVMEYINTLGGNLDSGLGGTIGAISGLIMNKAGIGKHTMFQW